MTSIGSVSAALGNEIETLGQIYEGPWSMRASNSVVNTDGTAAPALTITLPCQPSAAYTFQFWVDVAACRPAASLYGGRWEVVPWSVEDGDIGELQAPTKLVNPVIGNFSSLVVTYTGQTVNGVTTWTVSLGSTGGGFLASVNVDVYWYGSPGITQVVL